ncbi:MAG: type II toxin-antitoxin system HipA family toxin [Ideonella sp.]|nr:type II toxin-antitoxin system HipA family toxin [Ideonella sp.]MCC7456450.1 type II toxin-antitoxin system HipA family toxin [Nitrospira sp.]
MGRRSHARKLALWMNGERVGTWTTAPDGDALHYAAAWLGSPQARPLSLSLPFRPGNPPHSGPVVRDYFENLLPDSKPIRERLARRFGTATTGAFDLLSEIGRDCVGALQIVPDGHDPGDVTSVQARPLDEAHIARLLRATVTPDAFDDQGAGFDELRISIAGAQEKTALLWRDGRWWRPVGATPTTHILKLPLGLVGNLQLDLRDSVENEWLCARILAAYGLPVARCHPLSFEGQRVLGVERFDRRWADDGSWLIRLPQEDLCQATATPAHAKYEADGGPGIDRILGVLNGSTRRVQDRENFFRTQLLFWLLCAPDGHAKNFSIALHAGGVFSMTPLYDVVSAYPVLGSGPNRISEHRVKLAMALRSTNAHWRMRDILRRHWEEVGRRNGIVTESGQGVDALIRGVIDATPAALDQAAAGLPDRFPAHVADSILGGLKAAVRKLASAAKS